MCSKQFVLGKIQFGKHWPRMLPVVAGFLVYVAVFYFTRRDFNSKSFIFTLTSVTKLNACQENVKINPAALVFSSATAMVLTFFRKTNWTTSKWWFNFDKQFRLKVRFLFNSHFSFIIRAVAANAALAKVFSRPPISISNKNILKRCCISGIIFHDLVVVFIYPWQGWSTGEPWSYSKTNKITVALWLL